MNNEYTLNCSVNLLMESILKTNLEIMIKTIKDADLWKEFTRFNSINHDRLIQFNIIEFYKLHPDKFFIQDEKDELVRFVIVGGNANSIDNS